MAVGDLSRPEVQRFVGCSVISRLIQRLCVVPERRRAPARRVGAREAGRRIRELAGALVQHAGRHRRIVATSAREQAGELVRALEARGAEAVLAPVIRIQPLENLGALRAALTGLSAYRWVVFTSQNTVHIVFDRLVAWGLTPRVFATTAVAAIGSVTAEALTQRGVVPALVPDEFVAESLADALARQSGSLADARILIPSASDARDALAAGLQKHGASPESIPVYRTVPAKTDLRGLADDIKVGRIDAVTFTSSSTVRYFLDLVGRDAAISGQFVAATIGPITGATARELGLRDVMEAEPHTVPGLVESLVRRFA